MSTPTTDADTLTRPGVVTRPLVRTLAEQNAGIRFVLRTKPLTADQQSILESIARAPWPGGGWTWSNNSTTERLLEALVKRGLVGAQEGAHGRKRYTAIPEVSETWRALEQARERAYAEHKEAEARANREKHAALTAALEKEKEYLLAGLDLLAQQGPHLKVEVLAAARTRVESMTVPMWQGAW